MLIENILLLLAFYFLTKTQVIFGIRYIYISLLLYIVYMYMGIEIFFIPFRFGKRIFGRTQIGDLNITALQLVQYH